MRLKVESGFCVEDTGLRFCHGMIRMQPGTSAFRRSVGWLRTSRRVDPLRFAQRDFNAIAVCLSRGLPHDDHAIFVFIFVDDVYLKIIFASFCGVVKILDGIQIGGDYSSATWCRLPRP